MVTSWVADEFQTVIELVPTYLCIKWFCHTAVSQSEKSIYTDHGIKKACLVLSEQDSVKMLVSKSQ